MRREEDIPKGVHAKTFVETRTVAQKASQRCLKEQTKCQVMIPVTTNSYTIIIIALTNIYTIIITVVIKLMI